MSCMLILVAYRDGPVVECIGRVCTVEIEVCVYIWLVLVVGGASVEYREIEDGLFQVGSLCIGYVAFLCVIGDVEM